MSATTTQLVSGGEFYKLRYDTIKVKVVPQKADVAQGVPSRLRPRIFLTFGTTRVVGRQPYAPAAFTPGEIPGTYFQRLSPSQGSWFLRGEPRKKSLVTPLGMDPGTVRIVGQCLNHYATPGSVMTLYLLKVHLQAFLSISITQKCQILSCDILVANERCVYYYYYYYYYSKSSIGVLISPLLHLLPDVFCLIARIFRLMLVM